MSRSAKVGTALRSLHDRQRIVEQEVLGQRRLLEEIKRLLVDGRAATDENRQRLIRLADDQGKTLRELGESVGRNRAGLMDHEARLYKIERRGNGRAPDPR